MPITLFLPFRIRVFLNSLSSLNKEWCVIYYLGIDAESYVSYNNNPPGRNRLVRFYENANGAEVEIAQECVLNLCVLKDVACAFFENQKRPDAITWMEL